MKIKKIMILLIVGVLALVIGGCTNSSGDDPGDTTKSYPVKLYFASTTYITEGIDEENGELMPPIETTVKAEPGMQYLETIKMLMTDPDDEAYSTLISDKITFNSVEVKDDNTVYVDVASENLNGGSLSEILFIDQILYTLINSYEEIESVQFMVDGAIAESLMGHFETSVPLTINGEQ